MSVIAAEIPEDLVTIADALEAFCRAEVIGRHEEHHDLLNDSRNTFREDGRYSDGAVEHIRAVRMASANAGFFNVSTPESLGGAGMGMIAYYTLIEQVYRLCGPHNWLCDFVVSHWAFGPSAVLEKLTDRARAEPLLCKSIIKVVLHIISSLTALWKTTKFGFQLPIFWQFATRRLYLNYRNKKYRTHA